MIFDLKTQENPCKRGCPDRHSGCHASCEAYMEYYKARLAMSDEKAKFYKMRDDIDKVQWHNKRKRGQK